MLHEKYKINKGDTFELIKTLDDNSIDLLITSPPYNVGKAYE
jgi:adenine-specific DNA-methyltransferase